MIISSLVDDHILICYGLTFDEWRWLYNFADEEEVYIRELLLGL